MNIVPSALYAALLCCCVQIKSSSLSVKSTKEDASLHKIQQLLQRAGNATDNETFWKNAARQEMRSARTPFITDTSVFTKNRFSKTIEAVRAVVTHHSHKDTISVKFYIALLCELLDRELNGPPTQLKKKRGRSKNIYFIERLPGSVKSNEWSETSDKVFSGSYERRDSTASELSSFIMDEEPF